MRKFMIACCTLAAAASVSAQGADQKSKPTAKPSAAAQPSQADVRRGVIILKSFTAAINSDKVDNARKGKYVACLYNNPVKTISSATAKVIASNPKLDGNKAEHVFIAASGVCNALPTPAKVPASATQTKGKQPEGR